VDFLKPGEVVLTFDDGPLRRNTLRVLNALESHCTKATFFMVGRMAVADPAMVREIDRRGHTIGTHTWSHRKLGNVSAQSAKREIELGISAVSAALGRPAAPFFRFPYLSDPKSMITHLGERNIGTFSIDGDAFDYKTKSGSTVERHILRALKRRGKGILLFHDIQTSTARGLKSLLRKLHTRGYKIVHIVPKGKTKTIAAYDKIAKRRLGNLATALKASPLISRSVVWPISQQTNASVEPLVNKGPYVPKRIRSNRRSSRQRGDDNLPWLDDEDPVAKRKTANKKLKATRKTYYKRYKKRRPRRQQPEYNNWFTNPFWFE
jgi:peptidoglycan-N-acetylglucosamine deacetylase